MKWIIDFTKQAKSELKRLDKTIQNRIRNYVDQLETLSNPKVRGEQLKGNLSEFWKYRVGDYRLICKIEEEKLLILIVKIGHRREVYNR